MPAQQIDSGPIQNPYPECPAGSVGDVYANDKDLSGSVKDKLAIVATNTEHPEVDDGAQYVADHAAGPNGVANSVEFGPIPGIDDSTPESIKRITRKYSLAEVVDDFLIKVPSEFPDVSSSPLPGCSVEGFDDSKVGAVMPCNLERGLVHSLPMSPPQQEHCDLVGLRQRPHKRHKVAQRQQKLTPHHTTKNSPPRKHHSIPTQEHRKSIDHKPHNYSPPFLNQHTRLQQYHTIQKVPVAPPATWSRTTPPMMGRVSSTGNIPEPATS
ncbi:hypothetical protein Nepgr_024741 [Nepenthes gracilis]|uniref:Uncharacterized protein n=1 Tax=Nepenthes gracilis TaxID=150966 RepID=A0AAD3T4T5_NEPGR|nr:hypothetical protein Nepgr_024741 [Nepenthes gracilis]